MHLVPPRQLTDIGMVYLGQEPYFGGTHGILLGKEQLQMKYTLYASVSVYIVRPSERWDSR